MVVADHEIPPAHGIMQRGMQNGGERPHPVASNLTAKGGIMAKLVWRVKLITELEPGIVSRAGGGLH